MDNSLAQEMSLDLLLLGTVVAVQANFYQVRLDLPPEKGAEKLSPPSLLCTRRTRLKKIGQRVMVGDRVVIEEPDFVDGRGAIAEVLPRKTELTRPPVANVDQIFLLFALEEPSLDPWQLSKFLVKAESTSLELCLCLNKSDLLALPEQQAWQQRLQLWGYQPYFLSVKEKIGLETLMSRFKDKVTIIAGPSGMGKSSLINQLIPEVNLRVGKVSGKLQRGRHTTRHVELFQLPDNGLLADSPGFNQPDLDCEPSKLAWFFPEARRRMAQGNCRFSNCLHSDEPDCVVRGDWERYEYYLKFLEEAIAREEALQQKPDEESSLKLKIKASGKQDYEPKLATKKYRRTSRREKQQKLQELYERQSVEELNDNF